MIFFKHTRAWIYDDLMVAALDGRRWIYHSEVEAQPLIAR